MALRCAGTTLEVESGTSYIVVAEITSLDGPSMEVPTASTTHLSSSHKTYTYGVPDSGSLSFDCLFDPAATSHDALFDLLDTPSIVSWRLNFTDGSTTTYSFDGILTSFSPNFGGEDEVVTASGEIKISGAVSPS